MTNYTKYLATEHDMLAFAKGVSHVLSDGSMLYLHGALGAGKTTFTRGLLLGLGYDGKVKSPTYTLVHPYEINGRHLIHCDLYRLEQAAEVEHLGIREYIGQGAICVIEWAEKGQALLPEPDLACYIEFVGEGREIKLIAHSARGREMIGIIECAEKNL